MTKPWEKLGIPKSTYYDKLSKGKLDKSVQSNVLEEKSNIQSKVVFNGRNGNKCKNITREEMEEVLKRNPKAFVPAWYINKFKSREEALI